MLQEHEQGRAHVRAIADALPKARTGDGIAVASTASHLGDYVRLLRAHIDKENNALFPYGF